MRETQAITYLFQYKIKLLCVTLKLETIFRINKIIFSGSILLTSRDITLMLYFSDKGRNVDKSSSLINEHLFHFTVTLYIMLGIQYKTLEKFLLMELCAL